MAYKLRIEEKEIAHAIWGSLIDVEVKDESEELAILEFANRYITREHTIFHNGEDIKKTITERMKELKDKGVEGKKRGEK